MNLCPHLLHPQPNLLLLLYTDYIPGSKIHEKNQATEEMRVHICHPTSLCKKTVFFSELESLHFLPQNDGDYEFLESTASAAATSKKWERNKSSK